jgi:TRAP-type mannitol/chloroaromatic compound transport system permease small subunit
VARQAAKSDGLRERALIEKLAKRLEAVADLMGQVAAFTVLVLVLLVSTNVLLRYFFREGSVWSQELEWHLLAPIAMLGIPYALVKGDYVRVDILYERFPARVRLVLDILAALVGVAVALLLLKYAIPYVEKSWVDGEGSPDPGGLPARYILKGVLPLGFFVLFLQQAAAALLGMLRLVRGEAGQAAP